MQYIMNRQMATVFSNGQSFTIHNDHPNFNKVIKILAERNGEPGIENEVIALINQTQAVVRSDSNFDIRDGVLYYGDLQISNALIDRIYAMQTRHESTAHLEKFLERLMQNPSDESIMELYGFLEKNSLPITEDGCFLAYKKVRSDFTDIHSGQFDNSVGQTVRLDRDEVDDNRNNTCSFGLHACSWDYLNEFSSYEPGEDRVVIVKISPADVVSVPVDYNNAKLRCCGYEVIAEMPDPTRQRIVDYAVDTTKGELTQDYVEQENKEDEDDFDSDEYFDEELEEEENDDVMDRRAENYAELWKQILNLCEDVTWNEGQSRGYLIGVAPYGEDWKAWIECYSDFPLNKAFTHGMFTLRSVPKTNVSDYARAIVIRDPEGDITSRPKIYVFNEERLDV